MNSEVVLNSQVLHQVICNDFTKDRHTIQNVLFECGREYLMSSSLS